MKTSELTDSALDYSVHVAKGNSIASCEYWLEKYADDGRRDLCERYSTDWAQGGPIIDREIGNGLQLGRKTTGAMSFCFYAEYQGNMWEQLRKHYGQTPLIAAMRCYVASKLGNEIEIPEVLK